MLAVMPATAQTSFLSQSAGVFVEGGLFGNYYPSDFNKPVTNAAVTAGLKYSIGCKIFNLSPQVCYTYSKSGWNLGPGGVVTPDPMVHFNSFRYGADIEFHPLKHFYLLTGPSFRVSKCIEQQRVKGIFKTSYWRFGLGANFSRFTIYTGYQLRMSRNLRIANYPLFIGVGYSFWQK